MSSRYDIVVQRAISSLILKKNEAIMSFSWKFWGRGVDLFFLAFRVARCVSCMELRVPNFFPRVEGFVCGLDRERANVAASA